MSGEGFELEGAKMKIKDIREKMKLDDQLKKELAGLDDKVSVAAIKSATKWHPDGKVRTYSIDFGWVAFGPIDPEAIEKSLILAVLYSGECWSEKSGLGFAIPIKTVKRELLTNRFRLPLMRLKPTDGEKFGLEAIPGKMEFLPGKLFDLRSGGPMMAVQRGSWPAVLITEDLEEATHVYLEIKVLKEDKERTQELLKRPDVLYNHWREMPEYPEVKFSVLLARELNKFLCQ